MGAHTSELKKRPVYACGLRSCRSRTLDAGWVPTEVGTQPCGLQNQAQHGSRVTVSSERLGREAELHVAQRPGLVGERGLVIRRAHDRGRRRLRRGTHHGDEHHVTAVDLGHLRAGVDVRVRGGVGDLVDDAEFSVVQVAAQRCRGVPRRSGGHPQNLVADSGLVV